MFTTNKSKVFILFLSALCISGKAQINKYTNAYLDIGVGARALGLSNAFTHLSDDATAIYWNPAGLANLRNSAEVSLMHNEHFGGIVKYDFGGLGIKINEKSGLGIGIIRSGVDNIPNTLELMDSEGNINYDRITSFSVADYAVMIGYARKIEKWGLSYGVNAKVLHRNIGPFGKGWGFGIDAGVQYSRKNVLAGLMLRDISTTVTNFTYNTEQFEDVFAATGNEILRKSSELALPKIALAGGYKLHFDKKKRFHMTPSAELLFTTDGRRNTPISWDPISIDPRFGMEIGYKDIVYLRGGCGQIQRMEETPDKKVWLVKPNIGAGFRIKTVNVDYALASIGDRSVFLFSHVFSLRIGFNVKKKTKTTTSQSSKP
jgi:hypothetical protein